MLLGKVFLQGRQASGCRLKLLEHKLLAFDAQGIRSFLQSLCIVSRILVRQKCYVGLGVVHTASQLLQLQRHAVPLRSETVMHGDHALTDVVFKLMQFLLVRREACV